MRRALLILALLAAAAVLATGCGSSKSAGGSSDQALSFVPKDAPIVVTIDTDPNGTQWKNVDRLLSKFPGAGAIKTKFKQGVSQGSGGQIDFDNDLKPILGNQLVVAAPSAQAAQQSHFVAALKVNDESKAKKFLDLGPKVGTIDGNDVHHSRDGTSFNVLDDGVLVSAETMQDLQAAVNNHGGDHLTEDDLNKLTAGVGGDALMRIGVNVQALIAAAPQSAAARKVKWVAALRNYGEVITAQQDGIASNFKVTTDGSPSAADLPLASGPQSPSVVRRAGEVGFGIRNLAQSWHFVESVAQLTDPAGYGRYLKRKARASKQLGVNLDRDVIGQFTGDATLSVSLDGKIAFRSGVRDPASLQATLRKAGPRLGRLNPGKHVAVSTPKSGKGLYSITQPNGKKVVFGVIGKDFVAASDAPRAAQIAGQSPSPVPGAKGAGVVVFDARAVANVALQRAGQGAAALITGALGDFVLSTESETSGLTGSFKLNVK